MGRQPKEEDRKKKSDDKGWTIDQKWTGSITMWEYPLNAQADAHFHSIWQHTITENPAGGFHMWF